jgi:hypothetical protein
VKHHRRFAVGGGEETIARLIRGAHRRKRDSAKYGYVQAAVEKIAITGMTEICFLVEKEEPDKFRR